MRLKTIAEANIATQAAHGSSVGQMGTSLGGKALDIASSAVWLDAVAQVGQIAWQIINMVRNRQRATRFIQQAMNLPDNQREGSNIFDIDDALWDERTGVLNDTSKKQTVEPSVFVR